jgi:hypothetical protein
MLTCANCGEQNPERARFCLNCGASLAAEPRRGARKVVTVVVCDVSGSTALGERLDPESLGRVMARYFERTRAVLERHHGLVQKFIGDAVVATFGVPVVREDDALRAVRAAAAMQDAVAELDTEGTPRSRSASGSPPARSWSRRPAATRWSSATPSTWRPGSRRPPAPARSCSTSAPGTWPATPWWPRRWTGRGGAGGVRGLKEPPVTAWRLVDVSPDALGHARRSDSPLVGRLAELQLFDWVFQRTVRTSTCHLLTVLGPAGVGQVAAGRGRPRRLDDAATVLSGQCSPDAEGSSFWPVAEIVRRAAEIKAADSPEQAEAKLEELLDHPTGRRWPTGWGGSSGCGRPR